MPNTELDLWPDDIGHSDLVAPVTILRMQATLLRRKTKSTVSGDVVTAIIGNTFNHRFYLEAPAIDYRFLLFTIFHEISFYPLRIRSGGSEIEITNEEEFLEALKKEFNSEKARSVIESMVAQSDSGLTVQL